MVKGNEILSSGNDCLTNPIIVTSNLHPLTDGMFIENSPFDFVYANFLILPSVPFMMTDASANGSRASRSMTVPYTLTWANVLREESKQSRQIVSRLITWLKDL